MSVDNNGARSYKSEVIGDSFAITINFKWLLQICTLIAGISYGFFEIKTRIEKLEISNIEQAEQLRNLLDKHVVAERLEREQLAKRSQELEEQLNWYQKELNINPLSILKKKDKGYKKRK